jgi:hypothetical protein
LGSFNFAGLPGQGHQQHRGVEPLHEDRQLVQARPQEVQVALQMGQALQMSRYAQWPDPEMVMLRDRSSSPSVFSQI